MGRFDAVVIGLGGMGTATCYHLARRGQRVLGLEQYGLSHDRGSSSGSTRIIRKAYFEHPNYIPLLHETYELWSAVERDTARRLVHCVGLLLAGDPEGVVLSGVKRASQQHQLMIESLGPKELRTRFPAFSFCPQWEGLFERDAGYLLVEDCVRSHAELATRFGAALRFNERLINWTADDDGVYVTTDRGRYEADRLAICCGAWSPAALHHINLPMEIHRKVVLWIAPGTTKFDASNGTPVFGFETEDGFFYGFPAIDDSGVKVGDHTGGDIVPDANGLNRQLQPNDGERIHKFIANHLPALGDQVSRHSICMYSMTPDEHFVIDHHPESKRVAFAAGFSGHGFKFAPLVGSILADLLLDGVTKQPIEFLRLSRPALSGEINGLT